MSRLRVVILDEELPYPPNSGKRIRTLNLTLRLARRHDVTYLCHRNADAEEARQAAEFFRGHGVEPIVVDHATPPKHGPAFYARLATNLLSSLPYSVATHNSRALRDAILAQAATRKVDLWQCEWTPYAEALRVLPEARHLIVAHNVESLIWQRYAENQANPLARGYIKHQWRKFLTFERRALTEANHVVAVSDTDAHFFSREFGVREISVVDNGVDTEYFRPMGGPRDASCILFLGSLDWRPNLDAVDVLLSQVYPAVRAVVPEARLWIVGRKPPDSLRRRIFTLPGVELHADVADVRPFLAAAGVMAVPLRIGGGSRLKILEALCSGTPVVSTRIGAEGLCLEPGRHLTVVEAVEDMAEALTTALHDANAARVQAQAGQREVVSRYDWDVLADRLEAVWLKCVGTDVSSSGIQGRAA